MKKESLTLVVSAALGAAVLALLIGIFIFKAPANRAAKVPTIAPITTTLPDIVNDPTYNSFLNTNSPDFAQPVQVGNTQNNQPFNGSQ